MIQLKINTSSEYLWYIFLYSLSLSLTNKLYYILYVLYINITANMYLTTQTIYSKWF